MPTLAIFRYLCWGYRPFSFPFSAFSAFIAALTIFDNFVPFAKKINQLIQLIVPILMGPTLHPKNIAGPGCLTSPVAGQGERCTVTGKTSANG